MFFLQIKKFIHLKFQSKYSFIFCIVFNLTGILQAQESNLVFEHLTMNDGLSQNVVNAITQDDKGFLWIGTNEGLNRYDGYEFTVFNWDVGSLNKLSDEFIRCVFKDSKGNILVETAV